MLKRILKQMHAIAGPQHLLVGRTFHKLGHLYQEQRRYVEAERCLLQALATYEQIQGKEHEETALLLSQIATVLFEQGKVEERLQYSERMLTLLQKSIGHDLPAPLTPLEQAMLNRPIDKDQLN